MWFESPPTRESSLGGIKKSPAQMGEAFCLMPGSDLLSVGLGITFSSMGQFQMDLGASFADSTNNIILSGIYRF